MQIRYLYHSGFAIEADAGTVIIDYYKDDCDGPRTAEAGVVDADMLNRPGNFYVLSSHGHGDHFIPAILDWRQRRADIEYILSGDIRPRGDGVQPRYLDKGDTYDDDYLRITAFGSTDLGISFVLQLEGKTIFHAGDLNNWHWNEEVPADEAQGYEDAYLAELAEIKAAFPVMDAALFPVDPRLGRDYQKGGQQFLQAVKTGLFVPMHFAEKYDQACAFENIAQTGNVRFFPIRRRGETITL